MRAKLVIVHRYLGLTMAAFLLVAGLTGALLAWNDELEAAISPALFVVPVPASEAGRPPHRVDPLDLRAVVQARHPEAYVAATPLAREEGRPLVFFLFATPDPKTGIEPELAVDQVFMNPYTGAVLGERKWGDITQGWKNLMPFVYRLHFSLALGTVGSTLFGIVALLWTIDCFAGAYLTFPARVRSGSARSRCGVWLGRWWPSWKLRWSGGAYKRNFDLHRAGGLWPWAMLLVLAWSSVAFNLHEVYEPLMQTVLTHQPEEERAEASVETSTFKLTAKLGWVAARERGQALMAEAASREGFVVEHAEMLVHDPRTGNYRYTVRSNRDLAERGGQTAIWFDADSGALKGIWLPTGAATGDTFRTWITSLHMAAIWGMPFRLFMTAMGLAVALLSGTGVYIWWKKRPGRRRQAQSAASERATGERA